MVCISFRGNSEQYRHDGVGHCHHGAVACSMASLARASSVKGASSLN
jgi:hypothetical protein